MQYEEFIKDAVTKNIVTEQELKEKEADFKSALQSKLEKGFSLTAEEAKSMIQRQMVSYLKQALRTSLTRFQAILYGVDEPTVFGIDKLYDESVAKFNENPQEAIKNGFVNSEGQPLYHGEKYLKDSRFGKVINLETIKRRKILALVRKTPEEEWKEAQVSAQYDMCARDYQFPLFKLIETKLFISETGTTENFFNLSTRVGETEFNVIDNKIVKFKDLAKKYLKHRYVNVMKVEDWIKDHETERDSYFLTEASDINNIITRDGVYDTVIVNQSKELENSESVLVCSYPTSQKKHFSENCIDPILIGRGYQTKDKTGIRVILFGIWVSELQWEDVEMSSAKNANVSKDPEVVKENKVQEEAW